MFTYNSQPHIIENEKKNGDFQMHTGYQSYIDQLMTARSWAVVVVQAISMEEKKTVSKKTGIVQMKLAKIAHAIKFMLQIVKKNRM